MIGFAGLSHLGIVSSVAYASKGFEVVAYDENPTLCDNLNNQYLEILEPGLPELLKASLSHVRFTSDVSALGECNIIFFSEDTPTNEDNLSDLSKIHRLVKEIVPHAKMDAVLVILSQVPPGFTRKLDEYLRQLYPSNGFKIFCQVETLIFGQAVERAVHPERFIVGCLESQHPLPEAYSELLASFNCPILPMRYESAELAKISINMMLVSSISTTNTLAEICEAINADWFDIVPALKADKRIGPHAYLNPGLGISGGNLERDLATVTSLSKEHGTNASVIDAWISNSRHRVNWALKTLHAQVISHCDDTTIAVWGLSYKPDTKSTKNSPALDLIEALSPFKVKAYDPQAMMSNVGLSNFSQVKTASDAIQEADGLVIMTPWKEFSSIDVPSVLELMRGRVIVDPFGSLNKTTVSQTNFSLFTLGSSAENQEV